MDITKVVMFTDEDACYDAISSLKNYREYNIHPEHNKDIDMVTYEKDVCDIYVTGPAKYVNYVCEFAAETDLDRVIGIKKVKNIKENYAINEEEDGRFHDKPYTPTQNEVDDARYCIEKMEDIYDYAERRNSYISTHLKNFINGHLSKDDFNLELDECIDGLTSVEKRIANLKELLKDLSVK